MSERKKEYKTIKIPKETYNDIKDMGKGIGGAVDLLVKARGKAIEDKVKDLAEISEELGDIILEAGLFDIQFEGAGIESVREDGETLEITCRLKIGIPDDDGRRMILEALSPEGTEEEEEEE